MGDRAQCRLVAGPYDGDQGSFPTPLPDVLVVYPCSEGSKCLVGGIHWSTPEAFASADAAGTAERYKKGRRVKGVWLYVWSGANLRRSPSLKAQQPRQREPQPA